MNHLVTSLIFNLLVRLSVSAVAFYSLLPLTKNGSRSLPFFCGSAICALGKKRQIVGYRMLWAFSFYR